MHELVCQYNSAKATSCLLFKFPMYRTKHCLWFDNSSKQTICRLVPSGVQSFIVDYEDCEFIVLATGTALPTARTFCPFISISYTCANGETWKKCRTLRVSILLFLTVSSLELVCYMHLCCLYVLLSIDSRQLLEHVIRRVILFIFQFTDCATLFWTK